MAKETFIACRVNREIAVYVLCACFYRTPERPIFLFRSQISTLFLRASFPRPESFYRTPVRRYTADANLN